GRRLGGTHDLEGEVGDGEQAGGHASAAGAEEVRAEGVAGALGRGEPEGGADPVGGTLSEARQQCVRLTRGDRATDEEDGGHPWPGLHAGLAVDCSTSGSDTVGESDGSSCPLPLVGEG